MNGNETTTADESETNNTVADATETGTAASTNRNLADGGDEVDVEELRLQTELLREENERLRRSYALARRSSYRRTAIGLAVVGTFAAAGGALFPSSSDVLFALGGTGLFGAVLTYFLTPERFVAADVGAAVYGAMADTESAVVDQLGLTDQRVYVPTTGQEPAAWLFVPQHEEYAVPDDDALSAPFVAGTDERERGVSYRPTGAPLIRQLDDTRTGSPGDDPTAVIEQLTEALSAQFELVDHLSVDVTPDERRATVSIAGSAFGVADRFDHPIQSVLATGLASELDAPVAAETTRTDGDDDYLVTLRWSDA